MDAKNDLQFSAAMLSTLSCLDFSILDFSTTSSTGERLFCLSGPSSLSQ
uniref:Uncharacterized protein n=1 Tax=Arundo donax TaxID=35708 RepID=A0A0A9GBD2_ARUDO